jgi:hypothetical protein
MDRPGARTFVYSLINISKASERSVMDVVEHTEMVEKELDAFIERRAKSDPDPDEREESYMQSVRAYHARLEQAALWERARFHRRQLASHRATFREIIRRHKAGLAECEAALGITDKATKGDAA